MKTCSQLLTLCLSASLLIGVSACSSVPVDPCSKAGVEHRLTKSLRSFAVQNRSDLKTLKKVAQYIGGDSVSGKMEIVFALDALSRLAKDFEREVVPEISAIQRQCGTDDNVKEVFLDFLRNEGVSNKVLKWVEGIKISLDSEKA